MYFQECANSYWCIYVHIIAIKYPGLISRLIGLFLSCNLWFAHHWSLTGTAAMQCYNIILCTYWPNLLLSDGHKLSDVNTKKKQGVWICRDWYIYTITIKDQIAVVNMQGTQLACCSDSTCPIWHTQHFLFSLGMSLWWPVSILVHVAQPNIAESWELLQSSVHSAMPCHVPSVWLELKPGMALSLRWRYPFLPFQNRCKAWTHMVKF